MNGAEAQSAEAEMLFEQRGSVGVVTLNRPKALNALNLSMIRALAPRLQAWAADPAIRAVVVQGAGEKAFCAGGDVRAVYEDGLAMKRGTGKGALTREFFREEYILNHMIHRFPKPYIALLDGITMGGGVGLSVHGAFRVASERILVAMPETGIGLFPDVGGGWFLPRCPGEIGTYLALTGHRCQAADALYAGFVTHHVPAETQPALLTALCAADWSTDPALVARAILDGFHLDPGPAPLADRRDAIDAAFAGDRAEAILAALEARGDDWARETLKTLSRMSPTSLKISLRQLRECRGRPYEDCVTIEYRLSQGCMAGVDFYEGIRALLVDKDRTPRWQPASLAEVEEALVARHFAPPAVGDLILKAD